RLKDQGSVYTIRSAKKMIQRGAPEVWDVLEEIIKGHPVLLNRAPTLHRLGIQAFEPVLIEGKAIRVHPLVCAAFNADFDGDQMAVHVPLSIEAQLEAKVLMMAPDNIFLPSSGKPVATPSKDMTLGIYYLMADPTYCPEEHGGKVKIFRDVTEVLRALYSGGFLDEHTNGRRDETGRGIHIHEKIKVRIDGQVIETTPGRVLFNRIVPKELGFQNYSMPSKRISELILQCYKKVGLEATVRFLDDLKDLGFIQATKAAISMGLKDVKIPEIKSEILKEAYDKVAIVKKQYDDGIITDGERHSKTISIWTEVSELLSDALYVEISKQTKSK
ncbi:RNA polymerase Rpb1, domain 3 family protein, partial [Chlamydia psittaci 84-8471/1]